MGNESSLIRKCHTSLKPQYSTPEWSLYDANHASQRYSLMVFNEDVYFNDITRWKHIRHPNLVKCYEAGLNRAGKKCILLEPIEPIGPQLNGMHSSRILSGLYSIGEALSFLHDKCGLSANNLSVNSIFVSQKDYDEQWKLGSLYLYSSLDSDSEEFFKQLIQYHHAYNSINILPPEDREIRTHKLIRSSKLVHRRDSYAYTELLQSLLTNSINTNQPNNITPDDSSLLITVNKFVQDCNSRSPDNRLKIDEMLLNKIFVNCPFLRIRQFFLNFSTHNNFEKEQFFENLIDRLRSLPNELLIIQVFKMIVTSRVIMSDSFIYNSIMPYFLVPIPGSKIHPVGAESTVNSNLEQTPSSNYLLTNGQSIEIVPFLSETIFQEHIIPHISNLYCVHDFKIRILLLQYLPHYAHLIPKNHLRKVILPQILLGIKDSSAFLVSLTFRSLATLVEIFDVVTVLGGSKRSKIFITEEPRSNNVLTQSISKSDDKDNVSVKSAASSNSSSLNFITYKLQNVPSTERTSPDGNENDICPNSHKDALQLNNSMNNLNLVEDDDEWPDWENGNDSSSQFETAVESFTSSDTLNSGVTNNFRDINKPTNSNNGSNPNGNGSGTIKPPTVKATIQTFDIKEIDFHESKAEIDNLFLEMEPVVDFKPKAASLPTVPVNAQQANADAGDLLSNVVKNEKLFVLQNSDDPHIDDSGWGNDEDLDLGMDFNSLKEDHDLKTDNQEIDPLPTA